MPPGSAGPGSFLAFRRILTHRYQTCSVRERTVSKAAMSTQSRLRGHGSDSARSHRAEGRETSTKSWRLVATDVQAHESCHEEWRPLGLVDLRLVVIFEDRIARKTIRLAAPAGGHVGFADQIIREDDRRGREGLIERRCEHSSSAMLRATRHAPCCVLRARARSRLANREAENHCDLLRGGVGENPGPHLCRFLSILGLWTTPPPPHPPVTAVTDM
jgi:hypothetical protein